MNDLRQGYTAGSFLASRIELKVTFFGKSAGELLDIKRKSFDQKGAVKIT